MRSGQWIARALLGMGWVGFLFGLALLCRAYLCRRDGELGVSLDITLRGAQVCAAAAVVALPGWLFLFLPMHTRGGRRIDTPTEPDQPREHGEPLLLRRQAADTAVLPPDALAALVDSPSRRW